MKRAHRLALCLLAVAAVCLANPLYAGAIPETAVLGHAPVGGDAAAFAPDLRYLAGLALSAVGALAFAGALAAAFAGLALGGEDPRA